MKNIIDESFNKAFMILDLQQQQIEKLTIKQKLEVLEIVLKATKEKKQLYEAELRYRENIYRDYKAGLS